MKRVIIASAAALGLLAAPAIAATAPTAAKVTKSEKKAAKNQKAAAKTAAKGK